MTSGLLRILVPAAACVAGSAVAAPKIYWTNNLVGDNNRLMRMNLDGTQFETIYSEDTWPMSPIIDPDANYIYWADEKQILRSRLDGSEVRVVVPPLGIDDGWRWGLAIDFGRSKIYWTDRTLQVIRRSDLDGANIEDLIVGFRSESISLDLLNEKLYWGEVYFLDNEPDGILRRSNLDGTETEEVISTDVSGVTAVLVDPKNDRLFWSGHQAIISLSALDGTDRNTIAPGSIPRNGLALDPYRQRLFISAGVAYFDLASGMFGSLGTIPPFAFAGWGGVALDLRIAGDCDGDREVTMADLADFVSGVDGPDGYAWRGVCPEADDDGDLDLIDVARFQRDFVGTNLYP